MEHLAVFTLKPLDPVENRPAFHGQKRFNQARLIGQFLQGQKHLRRDTLGGVQVIKAAGGKPKVLNPLGRKASLSGQIVWLLCQGL